MGVHADGAESNDNDLPYGVQNPHGSVLVYIGKDEQRFCHVFGSLGMIPGLNATKHGPRIAYGVGSALIATGWISMTKIEWETHAFKHGDMTWILSELT